MYLLNADAYDAFRQDQFQKLHDQHWQTEQYHCMIKQVCHIEKFQVRGKVPICNHLFTALCSYVYLQQMRLADMIRNAYQWQHGPYQEVAASFVKSFMLHKEHLNPQDQAAVNA